MVSSTVATKIGRRMGVVEEVEKRYNKDGQNLFMRVKVAIPIAKLIRREGFLAGSNGDAAWACRSRICNTQLLQFFHET